MPVLTDGCTLEEPEKENCVYTDDDFHIIFEKIVAADALILGSPVYGADITAEMKVFQNVE